MGVELPPQRLIKGLHAAENQMPSGAPPRWREGKDEEPFICWWEILLAEVRVKLSREVSCIAQGEAECLFDVT